MKDNESKMRIEIELLKSKAIDDNMNKTQPMIIKQSSVAVKDSLNFQQMKNI